MSDPLKLSLHRYSSELLYGHSEQDTGFLQWRLVLSTVEPSLQHLRYFTTKLRTFQIRTPSSGSQTQIVTPNPDLTCQPKIPQTNTQN